MQISRQWMENDTQIADTFALAVPADECRVGLVLAIDGRVLDSASLTVMYSLNPRLR
jgi:hypothetical protein